MSPFRQTWADLEAQRRLELERRINERAAAGVDTLIAYMAVVVLGFVVGGWLL
jgi:antirestriction protein ArdC